MPSPTKRLIAAAAAAQKAEKQSSWKKAKAAIRHSKLFTQVINGAKQSTGKNEQIQQPLILGKNH